MHGNAMRDGRGLPPNIKPPRNGWHWAVDIETGPVVSPVAVRVQRQRYRDVVGAFSGGAFIHGWWSFAIGVRLGGTWHILYRWRERWADD